MKRRIVKTKHFAITYRWSVWEDGALLDQSLVPLAPATFFSTLNGYLFVESDPQATGTDVLSSPGTHCSVLELESGSCGVGLGSMVF